MEKEHLLTHDPSEQLSLEIRGVGVGDVQEPGLENQVEKLALDFFVFKHLKSKCKANGDCRETAEHLATLQGHRNQQSPTWRPFSTRSHKKSKSKQQQQQK